MRKVIVLVLAIILVISLAACATSNSNLSALSNNPKAEDVKSAIESIADIETIEIVTEDNDPNGNLGKQGGYTGALYFDTTIIKVEDWQDDDYAEQSPIDKGTDGGGCIEIYGNVKDAEKRDEYLASFDGGAFASYHQIHGTLVVRLSNSLTATQQKDLAQKIVDALS